ncbi:MAG TPA: methyltransferase domain-containing protein, partial [Candidatus Saccharimonadales bacterium]|nr:methyltransferase domain-containing protein [Candidatus Saccharimonadales bacterium]
MRRWWDTEGLCDIEWVYFEAIRSSTSLLDVGAGDLRIMRKLQAAGYQGEYHTQDVGSEGTYTYRDLGDVKRKYGAILCLDVIEHLPLADGLSMLRSMIALLEPGGALVIQTPNAAYIPDPRSWDMTHLHVYSAGDLWAWLTCEGLATELYRVALRDEHPGAIVAARLRITDYVKKKILGCDFA